MTSLSSTGAVACQRTPSGSGTPATLRIISKGGLFSSTELRYFLNLKLFSRAPALVKTAVQFSVSTVTSLARTEATAVSGVARATLGGVAVLSCRGSAVSGLLFSISGADTVGGGP